MQKNKVIERFCILASKVGEEVFLNQLPYDCFCRISDRFPSFQFDKDVMEFIENAVEEKINAAKVHQVDRRKRSHDLE